jgi:hypothetical protein
VYKVIEVTVVKFVIKRITNPNAETRRSYDIPLRLVPCDVIAACRVATHGAVRSARHGENTAFHTVTYTSATARKSCLPAGS